MRFSLLLFSLCISYLHASIATAQDCKVILADASQKTLEQVTAQHFKCSISEHLRLSGLPGGLADIVSLSPTTPLDLEYSNGKLVWKVTAGPKYAAQKQEQVAQALSGLLQLAPNDVAGSIVLAWKSWSLPN